MPYEEIEMLVEDLGSQGYRLLGGDGPIRPYLKGQLVIIGNLADTRILDCVVHFQHRGIDRVHSDDADNRLHLLLVSFRRNVTAAAVNCELHVQMGILIQRSNVKLGIENFYLGVCFDVARGNLALAAAFNVDSLGAVSVNLENHILQIQDNLGNVLLHTGERGEFVQNVVNFNGGNGISRQRGEQDAAQAVAKRRAVAALQRL